ncbi:MAG: hypothetical protein H7246_03675 [Phycisphaerae bacterium]|nr:hypothetical protein [Saprospiraceae bacterium]
MNDNSFKDRIWQHGLHEDQMFNERFNFFLTLQSILIAAVAILVDKLEAKDKWVGYGLIIIGIIISTVLWLIQAKQKFVLEGLRKKCQEVFPDYFETVQYREKSKWRYFSITNALAHWVPGLIMILWILILVFLIKK